MNVQSGPRQDSRRVYQVLPKLCPATVLLAENLPRSPEDHLIAAVNRFFAEAVPAAAGE